MSADEEASGRGRYVCRNSEVVIDRYDQAALKRAGDKELRVARALDYGYKATQSAGVTIDAHRELLSRHGDLQQQMVHMEANLRALQATNAAILSSLCSLHTDIIEKLPWSSFHTTDDDYGYDQFVPIVMSGRPRACCDYAVDW